MLPPVHRSLFSCMIFMAWLRSNFVQTSKYAIAAFHPSFLDEYIAIAVLRPRFSGLGGLILIAR